MKSCTTILSKALVRTGVIDIGRKSECWVGAVTFGTGRIQACFHWRGTVEVESDRLDPRKTDAACTRIYATLSDN